MKIPLQDSPSEIRNWPEGTVSKTQHQSQNRLGQQTAASHGGEVGTGHTCKLGSVGGSPGDLLAKEQSDKHPESGLLVEQQSPETLVEVLIHSLLLV